MADAGIHQVSFNVCVALQQIEALRNDSTAIRLIQVKVTPKASRNQVQEVLQEDGSTLYAVRVTAIPEDGKANIAVVKLLAKHFGIAKSQLTLASGASARLKTFKISA